MISIKRILSGILILSISVLISCSNANESKEEVLDLFDVFKGKDLATDYLINIRNGDINGATEICDKDL